MARKRSDKAKEVARKTVRQKKTNKDKNAALLPAVVEKRLPQVRSVPRRIDKDTFYVVGIGASAGGLEAFVQFFTNMPDGNGMAFVLIPHLDPTHKSIMPDLLKRYTKMKIFQVEDGMKVKPSCVYIIPPNRDMSILHGTLQLLEPKEVRGIRHPIDFFFRSLAEDQRERSICIVLSGTGSEGTLGLRAVKGEGGLVIVQDPKSAKYDGMPASAVATGLVDYILPPEKMPEQLLRYVRRVYAHPLKPVGKAEVKPTDVLQKIFVLIRAQTGHDFSLYKHNTVMRRIERRMAIHQIENLGDYVVYLRSNPHETEELFKELLIRVTNFFRDQHAFDVLRSKVLPHILKNRSHDLPVRIWVPGCSTGEEAYSIAMIFYEYMQKLKEKYKIQIFATDIDSRAIEIARAGQYTEAITVDVSPERLSRFFIKKGNTYKIKDEIRESVVFAVQNLIKDPPFSKLDMISCRNLLIYLGPELQKRILPLFRYAMNPESILFLGSSETIGEHTDMFSILDKKWKIFKARRLETPLYVPVELRPPALPVGAIKAETLRGGARPGDLGIGELAEKVLLDRYSPPCAIINDKGDILFVHGRTGKYLEPSPGRAAMNILDMAREGLRLELRTALRKVVTMKEDVTIEGLQVKTNGGYQTLNLTLDYIKKPEYLEGLIMAVFQDMPSPKVEKVTKQKAATKERADQRVAELEFELKSTREHLQTTIEELETSNEELKSTNEELQSANEELQSTNEELETSKEELQSVNEELVTVNSELQNKIDELSQVNNDMNNLLASTQIATIFLDNELRIKRFTPPMSTVFKLIQTDTGRPLSDIVSKVDYPQLVKDATEVMRTLTTREDVVRGENGGWYLTRIMPYRTVSNVIDGVVITFIDITEQKKAQETLSSMVYAEGIIETCGTPFLVIDKDMKVLFANKAFYQTCGETPKEIERKAIGGICNGQWNIPALRELIKNVILKNEHFKDFDVDLEYPAGEKKRLVVSGQRISRSDVGPDTVLLSMREVGD